MNERRTMIPNCSPPGTNPQPLARTGNKAAIVATGRQISPYANEAGPNLPP